MSEALGYYRELERQLWLVRWRNDENESAEEDSILDEMDQAWTQLTNDEQALLREEGPQCWPSNVNSHPRLAFEPSRETSWAYEGFSTPNQTILSEDAA